MGKTRKAFYKGLLIFLATLMIFTVVPLSVASASSSPNFTRTSFRAESRMNGASQIGGATNAGWFDHSSGDATILVSRRHNGVLWFQVRYSLFSGGTRTLWFRASDIIGSGAINPSRPIQLRANTTVHRTSAMNSSFGTVWGGNRGAGYAFEVARRGNNTRIIYRLDAGGHRMGWVPTSALVSGNTTNCTSHTWNNRGFCTRCNVEFRLNITTMAVTSRWARNNNVPVRNRPYAAEPSVRTLRQGEEVRINARANNAFGNRWYRTTGNQWIYSGNLTATRPPQSTLTLSRSTLSVVAGGVTTSVTTNITSNTSWTIRSNVSWITNLSRTSGNGNSNFTFRVAANTGVANRTGIITVRSNCGNITRELRVTQQGRPNVTPPTVRGVYNRNNPSQLLVRSNGQTTPHFTVADVRCFSTPNNACNPATCPATFPFDPRLVDVLHNLRVHFGSRVIVNDGVNRRGFRCLPNTGGRHNRGMAADVRINGVSREAIYDFVVRQPHVLRQSSGNNRTVLPSNHGGIDPTYIGGRMGGQNVHIAVR